MVPADESEGVSCCGAGSDGIVDFGAGDCEVERGRSAGVAGGEVPVRVDCSFASTSCFRCSSVPIVGVDGAGPLRANRLRIAHQSI